MPSVKPIYIEPDVSRKSLQKHQQFLDEQYIEEAVWNTPDEEIIYEDDESHFRIERLRKTNGKWIKVTIWVHDRKEFYWVGKVHVTSIG